MARTAMSDDDFDFGDIEVGTVAEVPTARRAGGGSRFPFDKLPEPSTDKAGKPVIGTFFVPYKDGLDEKKFRRAVQSATTQANRTKGRYFESRSVTQDGKFTGISVYRTDERPKE